MDEVSKSQIDRLGDRLRAGNIDEEDLRLLDRYRLSFSEAYEFVVRKIRDDLRYEPTGRPAKSTTSISEKLRRETIRLTQIQDIAGCRIVTPDMLDQVLVVNELEYQFKGAIIVDRRENPSHGYRAVHVIVQHHGKLVEIQVRTALQHLWGNCPRSFPTSSIRRLNTEAAEKTGRIFWIKRPKWWPGQRNGNWSCREYQRRTGLKLQIRD